MFGDAATCFDLTAGGGVTFECVNGTDPGLTPFANASTLTIWARNNESTPTGSISTESISSGVCFVCFALHSALSFACYALHFVLGSRQD